MPKPRRDNQNGPSGQSGQGNRNEQNHQSFELEDELIGFPLAHSYPNPADAVGIYVCGRDDLMSHGSHLYLMDSHDGTGLYDFQINLTLPPDVRRRTTVSRYVANVLDTLNLPPARSLFDEGPYLDHFDHTDILPGEGFLLEGFVTRSFFEELYVRIATSTFVQLSPDPCVGYVLRQPHGDLKQKLLSVFYEVFPQYDAATGITDPELRPVFNRNLDMVGFATYNPDSVFFSNQGCFYFLIPEEEPRPA